MVIIKVQTNGGVVGCCDASCYDAKGPDCTCICGGANHGVGLRVALEDRHYLTHDEILAECKNVKPGDPVMVYKPAVQGTLW